MESIPPTPPSSTHATSLLAHAFHLSNDATVRESRLPRASAEQERALERAIQRAIDETLAAHGDSFRKFGIVSSFFANEGVAAELAKVIVPGGRPSATRIAERFIDSLGYPIWIGARLEILAALRPVFAALLSNFATEIRREPTLHHFVGRFDATAIDADYQHEKRWAEKFNPIRGDGSVKRYAEIVGSRRSLTRLLRRLGVLPPSKMQAKFRAACELHAEASRFEREVGTLVREITSLAESSASDDGRVQ